jgi:hypothetical protein
VKDPRAESSLGECDRRSGAIDPQLRLDACHADDGSPGPARDTKSDTSPTPFDNAALLWVFVLNIEELPGHYSLVMSPFLLLHLSPHSLVDFAGDEGLLFPSSAEFPGIDEVDSRFFEVSSVAGGQGSPQCRLGAYSGS